jgi:hypothetical protein
LREIRRFPRGKPGNGCWHRRCYQNSVMIVALIILGFVAAGVVLGLVAATSAPVGYQDEAGFHFGGPGKAARTEEGFAYKVSHAKA